VLMDAGLDGRRSRVDAVGGGFVLVDTLSDGDMLSCRTGGKERLPANYSHVP